LYYKRWFHTNQTVLLQKESISAKVVIKGITDQGLLMAEDVATKTVYDLQPDGNSFDIFKGLVYTKH
jgi:biotin--protein ligase